MSGNKKIGAPYQYFFILGNTPILSSAEIFSVLARQEISAQWISVSEEVAVVETMALLDEQALLRTLGGTIKIGILLSESITIEQWVRSRKHEGKLVVGVSVYKSAVGVSNTKCDETLRTIRGEILNCKRLLKEEGKTLRLVTTRDRMLPSVALVTEHILERGGELVILLSHKGTQFGETLAVQAFHEYRHRDMGRPLRDALRGMLPPKVARMMVNLAGVKDDGVILDPFCGSGTVLSEAALLEYRIVGSDVSREAVADAKENMEWLAKSQILNPKSQTNSKFQISNFKFFISDVRHLKDHLQNHSVDAIVTEPYLGPPLTGRETSVLLGKVRRDVQALVTDAFEAFAKVLRVGGRVVIVLPVYQRSDLNTAEIRPHALLPIDDIQKLGWRLVSPLPPVIASSAMAERSNLTSRNTILYGRPDQHLAREITVWERT